MVTTVSSTTEHNNEIGSLKQLYNSLNGKAPTYSEALQIISQASGLIQDLPQYDAIGMNDLVERLRHELKTIHTRENGFNSINKLSSKIKVSRSYLARFRDGEAVCMNIMNRIASAFGIRYLVENYDEQNKLIIE